MSEGREKAVHPCRSSADRTTFPNPTLGRAGYASSSADATPRRTRTIHCLETALPKLSDRPARGVRGALLIVFAAAALPALAAPPVDADAARALAKKSDCFKCHTVDEKKDGPAYREVAKKYRGKADAESKLYTHMTTSPKVKIDGEEENHQMVKSKDDAEIHNLIRFILSLPNP